MGHVHRTHALANIRIVHLCWCHVALCVPWFLARRQHYLDQRRLQITADLQPPFSFLQAYQAYLSQVGDTVFP
jgi:hypothetical protein